MKQIKLNSYAMLPTENTPKKTYFFSEKALTFIRFKSYEKLVTSNWQPAAIKSSLATLQMRTVKQTEAINSQKAGPFAKRKRLGGGGGKNPPPPLRVVGEWKGKIF